MISLKNILSRFTGAPKDSTSAPHYYLAVCCIIKDENEYLEEWLDYHVRIGVEHFFIYDNGSKSPVKTFVQSLPWRDAITVTEMPGVNKHVKAYQHCLDHFGGRSQWIAFIDMDEFIVPKNESGNLPDLLKNYESYGGLGLSWQIFGSNGHVAKPAGSQLQNFIKKADINFDPNRHIKTIVQPQHVAAAWKSHCFRYKPGFFCVNEHLVPIDDSKADVSVDTVQLNHYYCRSLEEYRHKVDRGISDTKRKRKMEEFYNHDRDANAVTDTTILTVLEKARAAR